MKKAKWLNLNKDNRDQNMIFQCYFSTRRGKVRGENICLVWERVDNIWRPTILLVTKCFFLNFMTVFSIDG